MGLCIKTPVRGKVVFHGCDQAMLDANVRLLPEDPPVALVNATAGETTVIDAIYFGAAYGRLVIKVPSNCRAEVTCMPEGSFSIRYCCNLFATYIWPRSSPEKFPGGTGLPRGFPPNNF